ncbi:MAG: C2 family cysteine protease [Gammaproteobacteria bacterium]|nr:C2 family cysteine protease [Gammaproteobacteria bacterium]
MPFPIVPTAFDTVEDPAFVNPGVRGELTCDLNNLVSITTTKTASLPRGQKVIIRPTGSVVSPRYMLTSYTENLESARDDMAESKADIIVGDTYQISGVNPKKIFRFKEFFRRTTDPLFPTSESPNLSEIQQFQIPDCALLATVQGILNHPNGAAFIRGMMRDNFDGTTTVRFFNPKTYKAEYYTVSNSIAYEQSGKLSKHLALWIHVLEKAFAARGFESENIAKNNASIAYVYSNGLSANFSAVSLLGSAGLTHLFGSEAKQLLPANQERDYFSRAYSVLEHSEFDRIQCALAGGSLITASCAVDDAGLLSGHAYTVMGVEKKVLDYKDESSGEKKSKESYFIRLRNPWGRFGRDYSQYKNTVILKAKETENREFLIELKDFYRCFSDIHISDTVNLLFQKEAEKQKLQSAIYKTLNAEMNFSEYSIANMLSENHKVEKTKNDLISLELLSLSVFSEVENNAILACLNDEALITDPVEQQRRIINLFRPEVLASFGNDQKKIKERLYQLVVLRHSENNPILMGENEKIELINRVIDASPYNVYWDAWKTRKNIINLYVLYEANEFLRNLESFNELLIQFMEDPEKETNELAFTLDKYVALECRLIELNETVALIRKFSSYLSPQHNEIIRTAENQILSLNNLILEAEKKSNNLIEFLLPKDNQKDAKDMFQKIRAETIKVQKKTLRWNGERKISDAARNAISSAIIAGDVSIAGQNLEDCPISDKGCTQELNVFFRTIIELKNKFCHFIASINFGSVFGRNHQYEKGAETKKEKKEAVLEILKPLSDAQIRLDALIKNTAEHSQILALKNVLSDIKKSLNVKIEKMLADGKSYYEIDQSDVGRIAKNIGQCFDKVMCDSLADPSRQVYLSSLIENLNKKPSLISAENECCSFSLGYALSKKTDHKIVCVIIRMKTRTV